MWHCDRLGRYSLYSSGVTSQNFLRGIQETDSNGNVSVTSIYPGCYSGRWPHIHFEIYENVADAERFEAELGALAERHGLAALLAPGSARKREVFLGF